MSSIGDIMMIHSPGDLGLAIRDRRKQLGLDQQTLARRAGVSRQWLIEVEQGKTRAAIGLLLQTVRALDLELQLTVSGAGARARPPEAVDLDALIERAKQRKRGRAR
jgi:HTH-type transcriptional regulator/antitoxin HipB